MTTTTSGHAPRPRTTDIDHQLGAWLRRRRIDRGLTQAQMAEKLGVTYQQLNKYERGINRLTAGRLLEVTSMLGIDLTEVAAEIGNGTSVSHGPRMTATARQVHERVSRLTTAQQRGVLNMLEALAGDAHQTCASRSLPEGLEGHQPCPEGGRRLEVRVVPGRAGQAASGHRIQGSADRGSPGPR